MTTSNERMHALMMTASELIEILQSYPPDAEVSGELFVEHDCIQIESAPLNAFAAALAPCHNAVSEADWLESQTTIKKPKLNAEFLKVFK